MMFRDGSILRISYVPILLSLSFLGCGLIPEEPVQRVGWKEVRGRVILEGATDHSGVEVKESLGRAIGITDKDGNYRIKLPPGRFILVFRKGGYNMKTLEIEVKGDQNIVIVPDVLLTELGSIYGRVIRTDGTPAKGIDVWVGGVSTKTDDEGRYRLKGEIYPIPGIHTVCAVIKGEETSNFLFSQYYCVKVKVEEGEDAIAPDIIIPVHPAPYIREWLVLGPFSIGDGIYTQYVPGIEGMSPREGEEVKGKRWRRIKGGDWVGLTGELFPRDNCVAYCHSYVYSPKDMDAFIFTAHDDGMVVWINGGIVYREENHKYEVFKTLDDQDIPIRLKGGWNRVLVLITQLFGPWGFKVQIHKGKREEIPELKYSISPG